MSSNVPGGRGVPGRGKGAASQNLRRQIRKGPRAPGMKKGAEEAIPEAPPSSQSEACRENGGRINITKTPSFLFPLLKGPKAFPLPARK